MAQNTASLRCHFDSDPHSVDLDVFQDPKNTIILLADTFAKYVHRNVCEFIRPDEDEELSLCTDDLLDHVMVSGGYCRDVLLDRPSSDIDIFINLREFTKMQGNHVKRYHQRKEWQGQNVRCALWQRHLNQFRSTTECKSDLEMDRMHDANYVLNAKFWIGILQSDLRFKFNMTVHDVYHLGRPSFEIMLGSQRIIISDTINRQIDFNTELAQRPRAINTVDFNSILELNIKADSMLHQIDVPVYSVKLRYCMLNADFSINTCILPLSSVLQYNRTSNNTDEMADIMSRCQRFVMQRLHYLLFGFIRDSRLSLSMTVPTDVVYQILLLGYDLASLVETTNHIVPTNPSISWSALIEKGIKECDGINDCKEKNLRTPHIGTFIAHPTSFVFWRIVQCLIREPDFKLHRTLNTAQWKDYNLWLNNEWMNDTSNCQYFMRNLKRMLDEECASIGDVKHMLRVMHNLSFHRRFNLIVETSLSVKKALIETLSNVENPNLENAKIIEQFKAEPYSYFFWGTDLSIGL